MSAAKWIKVFKIKTETGEEHVTADPDQALFAAERHGKPVTVTSDRMSPADYEAIPSTNSSHEFFKMG